MPLFSSKSKLPAQQSDVVKGATEKAGEGKPRRHYILGEKQELVYQHNKSINTLYDCFMQGCSASGGF
jgi:hypothetical protein